MLKQKWSPRGRFKVKNWTQNQVTREMSYLSTWWLQKMIRLHLSIVGSPFILPVFTLQQHATQQPYPMACNLDLQPISLIWEEFLGRTPICTLDILVINTDQIKVSAGQYHVTVLWALVFSSLRSHAQMLVSVYMQPRKDCYSWGRGGLTKTEFWVINPWWVHIHKVWKSRLPVPNF